MVSGRDVSLTELETLVENMDLESAYRYLDRLTTPVSIWRGVGEFVHSNRAFFELLGYTPAELRALPRGGTIHPSDRANVRARVERADAGHHSTQPHDVVLQHKDGRPVHVIMTLTHFRTGDGPAGRLHAYTPGTPDSALPAVETGPD